MRHLRHGLWYAMLTTCLAVAGGSLWAIGRLPSREQFEFLCSPQGYLTLSRQTPSERFALVVDGDGVALERNRELAPTMSDKGWHLNLDDHGPPNLGIPSAAVIGAPPVVLPIQTRRWVDVAGVQLISRGATDEPGLQSSLAARVPHWLIVSLAAILPVRAGLALLLYRRRFDAGHCPACGYDLRATPARCPECGTEIEEHPADETAA